MVSIPLHGLQRTATVVTITTWSIPSRRTPSGHRSDGNSGSFSRCAPAPPTGWSPCRGPRQTTCRSTSRRAPDAVIEPLARPAFVPVERAAADATLHRLGVSTPYLLTVGTLEPRKNLRALVEAHAECTAGGAALPTLVIAGGRGWLDASLHEALADPALGRSHSLARLRADRCARPPVCPLRSLRHAVAVRGIWHSAARSSAVRRAGDSRRPPFDGRGGRRRRRFRESDSQRPAQRIAGSGGQAGSRWSAACPRRFTTTRRCRPDGCGP